MALSLQLVKSAHRAVCTNMTQTLLSCSSTVRYQSSGRKNCGEDPSPRCNPEKLKKNPCEKPKRETGIYGKEKSPFAHLIVKPECCYDPCPDVPPRFDDLYYKPSDKAKRHYMQTWTECPEKPIIPKHICSFEKLNYPKMEKRPRKDRPETAKSQCLGDFELLTCDRGKGAKCAKVTMPGCRGARDPPKCKRVRIPLHCRKICCPYPAFSECKKDKIKPKHPIECKCLAVVPMCEVYAEIRRLAQYQ